MKDWIQDTHVECMAQLAAFPPGREALLAEPAVTVALQVVVKEGWTDAARALAGSALGAMSDREREPASDGASCDSAQQHVMLSCKYQAEAQSSGCLAWLAVFHCG
eukprot:COSAG02_NODE_1190_length_13989_cov_9.869978_2_plen_106_part_00